MKTVWNDLFKTGQDGSQGTTTPINIIQPASIEPDIVIIAPPAIMQAKDTIAYKFKGAEHRCLNLSEELETIVKTHNTHFFDTNEITGASAVNGIHLDKAQHQQPGKAIADVVGPLI